MLRTPKPLRVLIKHKSGTTFKTQSSFANGQKHCESIQFYFNFFLLIRNSSFSIF